MYNNKREKTDLGAVKETAKAFLFLEPVPNKAFPFFVDHPFTNSAFVFIQHEDRLGNIINSKEDLKCFRDTITEWIEKADKASSILFMIDKKYRLAFIKAIVDIVDAEDLGLLLRETWTSVVNIVDDPNITKNQIIGYFKAGDPNTLMYPEDREILEELPEEITVYRGVRNKARKYMAGLSWTTDKRIATWFSERYKVDGEEDDLERIVYQATISKKHVLAYYDFEKEIVANPKYLKDIKKVEKVENYMDWHKTEEA